MSVLNLFERLLQWFTNWNLKISNLRIIILEIFRIYELVTHRSLKDFMENFKYTKIKGRNGALNLWGWYFIYVLCIYWSTFLYTGVHTRFLFQIMFVWFNSNTSNVTRAWSRICLTLPEHLKSVFCVMFCRTLFVFVSFFSDDHCIVTISLFLFTVSDYLWYFQTFLK